jgi:hypothetical protein
MPPRRAPTVVVPSPRRSVVRQVSHHRNDIIHTIYEVRRGQPWYRVTYRPPQPAVYRSRCQGRFFPLRSWSLLQCTKYRSPSRPAWPSTCPAVSFLSGSSMELQSPQRPRARRNSDISLPANCQHHLVRPAYDPGIVSLTVAAVCRAAVRAARDVAGLFLAMLEIAASSYKVPGRHTRHLDLAGRPFAPQWLWSGSLMELRSPPRPRAR